MIKHLPNLTKNPAVLTIGLVLLGVLGLKSYETMTVPTQPQPEAVVIRDFSEAGSVAGSAVNIEQQILDEMNQMRDSVSFPLTEVAKKVKPTGEQRFQVTGLGSESQLQEVTKILSEQGFLLLSTEEEAELLIKDAVLCSAAENKGDLMVICQGQ